MRFLTVGSVVLAAAQECLDDEQCTVGSSQISGSSLVQSVHREAQRIGHTAHALVEDDEIEAGILDLKPTMRTRLDGNVLHVAVEKVGGATSLLELQEFSPVPGEKFSFRSFKSKSNELPPVKAQVHANGDVTGWFGFDDGFMELNLNQRTNATSQQRTRKLTHSLLQEPPSDYAPVDGAGETGAPRTEHSAPVGSVQSFGNSTSANADGWDGDVWYPNCFPGDSVQWTMQIGVLVDQSAKEWATNWEQRITAIVAAASVVYQKQMNIELAIAEFQHYPGNCADYGDGSETGSGRSAIEGNAMGKQLKDVQTNFLIPNTVTTHLFTGCDNDASGVVGLAFVGCLSAPCAAVNNIKADWGTFGHELGHNFNGGHSFEEGKGTTGGIMDYGDNKHDGVIQFNSDYRMCGMCSEIAQMRKQGVTGFAPTESGANSAEAQTAEPLWDLPRGCGCNPQPDKSSDEPAGWTPASMTCAAGADAGWCSFYQWFRSACETSCAATEIKKFGCWADPADPSRKVAWWETDVAGIVDDPQMYTTMSGCNAKLQMDREGVLETEVMQFRCCNYDGTPGPKGDEKGICAKGQARALTLAQARTVCQNAEQQLCTVAQLDSNLACKTGCRCDKSRVWTADLWQQ